MKSALSATAQFSDDIFSGCVAETIFLAFDFANCTFPEVSPLMSFYYFFIDVSTQTACTLSLMFENEKYNGQTSKKQSHKRSLVHQVPASIISLSPRTHWNDGKYISEKLFNCSIQSVIKKQVPLLPFLYKIILTNI